MPRLIRAFRAWVEGHPPDATWDLRSHSAHPLTSFLDSAPDLERLSDPPGRWTWADGVGPSDGYLLPLALRLEKVRVYRIARPQLLAVVDQVQALGWDSLSTDARPVELGGYGSPAGEG